MKIKDKNGIEHTVKKYLEFTNADLDENRRYRIYCVYNGILTEGINGNFYFYQYDEGDETEKIYQLEKQSLFKFSYLKDVEEHIIENNQELLII